MNTSDIGFRFLLDLETGTSTLSGGALISLVDSTMLMLMV